MSEVPLTFFFFFFDSLQMAVKTKNASFIRFAKAMDQEMQNVFARPVALRWVHILSSYSFVRGDIFFEVLSSMIFFPL